MLRNVFLKQNEGCKILFTSNTEREGTIFLVKNTNKKIKTKYVKVLTVVDEWEPNYKLGRGAIYN